MQISVCSNCYLLRSSFLRLVRQLITDVIKSDFDSVTALSLLLEDSLSVEDVINRQCDYLYARYLFKIVKVATAMFTSSTE